MIIIDNNFVLIDITKVSDSLEHFTTQQSS